MKITTKKISNGRYAVLADGKQTTIITERGNPPKYRNPQEWSIGVLRGEDDIAWLTHDQIGLSGSVHTVSMLLNAGLP